MLARDKFRRYVSPRDAQAYVAFLRRFAVIVSDVKPESADFLVSGDPHLAQLKNTTPEVLSPRAFLNRLPR